MVYKCGGVEGFEPYADILKVLSEVVDRNRLREHAGF